MTSDINVKQQRRAGFGSPLCDGLLLLLLLATFNSVVQPAISIPDQTFSGLNPSPYLLLPLYLGARYGALWGILGGGAGVGMILLDFHWLGTQPASAVFNAAPYFVLSFLVFGVMAGGIHGHYNRQLVQCRTWAEHYRQKIKQLDTDLQLLHQSKVELEQGLAVRENGLFSLDVEIRKLYEYSEEDLYQGILFLLSRHARITDAGFYLFDGPESAWPRRAYIGSPENLPEAMRPEENRLVRQALQKKTAVTLVEPWKQTGKEPHPFLMALPLLDWRQNVIAVVVVADMSFIDFHPKTTHLAHLLCQWAAEVVDIKTQNGVYKRSVPGTEGKHIFNQKFFKKTLDLAYQSYCQHHIPSSLVLFKMPEQTREHQTALESWVLPVVRTGDFAADLELPYPNLAVLLPLTGERGARIFRERALEYCRKTGGSCREPTTEVTVFHPKMELANYWQNLGV